MKRGPKQTEYSQELPGRTNKHFRGWKIGHANHITSLVLIEVLAQPVAFTDAT